MTVNHILHGGDYNPEQWLRYPDILEEDLRLMKKADINCVTLGVFSWSVLEPEEGVYNFQWLEDIIERLSQEGISVILATPSGAMPHWLTTSYPEVMQVQENGQRNLPGRRHNFCYTSPVMRRKIRQIDLELSKRFGSHRGVILWHISNELGGNFADGACHCELCQQAFREWLKEKYRTLDNLNRAWWSEFWSHVYTCWDQIHSPVPTGECLSDGLKLDWRRFVSEQMTDFCETEIAAVRKYSKLPVTTNFMYFFKNLDYHRLSKCLDVVSWDNYPYWHKNRDEVPVAVSSAACHSLMRSMKKKPFLLMESTPSVINWRKVNPVKRPGMHMLSCLQAVAHGSDAVLYFQWRKGRGGFEKFHGAVIDHKNGENTRTFRETAQVGERLRKMESFPLESVNRARAAIIFDWENWWALEDMTGPRLDIDYVKTILMHYQVFWESGVDVDFIGMDEPLDEYRLVCAPVNYLYKKGYPEKVENYVKNGGIYVTTCFSGMVDERTLCFTKKHPLEDVLGVVQEEIDAPSEEFPNSVIFHGESFRAGNLREVVHPGENTEVLAVYQEDYCKGCPVLTRHNYGRGEGYYLAAVMETEFLRTFYRDCMEEAGIYNPLGICLPYGVTTSCREGEGKFVFVMNFRHEPVTLENVGKWKNVETGEIYKGEMNLAELSCIVVTEDRQ